MRKPRAHIKKAIQSKWLLMRNVLGPFQVTAIIILVLLLALLLSGQIRIPWMNSPDGTVQKIDATPGDVFIADVTSGNHTLQATAHAYTFVSQYVRNGGNIYEVYDFIESHPELSFLKKAQAVYPTVFDHVQQKQLPHTYSDNGLYAYLAYLEILEQQGYGGITVTGELAYQYSKFAYYMKMILADKHKGQSLTYPNYSQTEIADAISKATVFAQKADSEAVGILTNTTDYPDIASVPAFKGLVQYASAIRFLQALDVTFSPYDSSKDIFTFATTYARKGGLPDMYLPVYLSHATSLLVLPNPDQNELRNALVPFFSITAESAKVGLVKQILNSKYTPSISRFSDLNMLSYATIRTLGTKVPEFKAWLLKNGWGEIDFQ
jgi:hypothetical protein